MLRCDQAGNHAGPEQAVDISRCTVCFAKGFKVLGFGCEVSALGIEHFQEIELAVLETNGGGVIGRLRTGQNVLLQ